MGGQLTGNWVKEDPEIQAIVDQYLPPVRAFQRQVIGKVPLVSNLRRSTDVYSHMHEGCLMWGPGTKKGVLGNVGVAFLRLVRPVYLLMYLWVMIMRS